MSTPTVSIALVETRHRGPLREFAALFPATIELAACAIVFALVIGIPAGMIAAVRRNSVFDHGVMGVSLTGYSMPIFWWGLLLILTFSVWLGWTPVSGRIAIEFDIPPVTGFMLVDSLLSGDRGAFKSALSHLILPSIALGTIPLAVIARMTRSSMLEVLREDYVRTARAKGAGWATPLMSHGPGCARPSSFTSLRCPPDSLGCMPGRSSCASVLHVREDRVGGACCGAK